MRLHRRSIPQFPTTAPPWRTHARVFQLLILITLTAFVGTDRDDPDEAGSKADGASLLTIKASARQVSITSSERTDKVASTPPAENSTAVSVGGSAALQVTKASTVVQPALSCIPTKASGLELPDAMRARAIASPGEPWMWQRVYEKFKAKKPVVFLGIGSSILVQPWPEWWCKWLEAAIPGSGSSENCLNGAVSGAGIMFQYIHLNMSGRLERDIREIKPDIILMEHSVSTWLQMADPVTNIYLNSTREAYYTEQVVRTVLQFDFKPLLIAFEWVGWWETTGSDPGFLTNEDAHLQVYKYYGIPVCSARDSLWPHLSGETRQKSMLLAREKPAWPIKDVFKDDLHPTPFGNQLIVDLVTGFFCDGLQRTEATLAKESPSDWPAQLPPILMTDAALARLDVQMQSSVANLLAPTISPQASSRYGSLGNTTMRVESVLMLLSGGALLAWEMATSTTGPLAPSAMEATPFPLAGLGLIRVYAHVHIVLMHYYQLQPEVLMATLGFPAWSRWGKYWVQLFFVLSGFVSYLSNAKERVGDSANGSIHPVKLLAKRLSTLYPTFFLSILIAISSVAGRELLHNHPEQLVFTLFLVQTWVPPFGAVALNGPSWFLCTLFAYYIVLPRWLSQVQRTQRPGTLLGALWLVAGLFPVTIAAMQGLLEQPLEEILESGLNSFLDFHPACSWHLFVSGIILARLVSDWHSLWSPWVVSRVAATSATLLLTLLFMFIEPPSTILAICFDKGLFLLPVFGCLLVGLALGRDVVFGARIFEHWIFQDWLPGCAWCLYILHVPLYFAFHTFLERRYRITHPLSLLALALATSAVVNNTFDTPLRRAFRARNSGSKDGSALEALIGQLKLRSGDAPCARGIDEKANDDDEKSPQASS